jgi:hypothetical protein
VYLLARYASMGREEAKATEKARIRAREETAHLKKIGIALLLEDELII